MIRKALWLSVFLWAVLFSAQRAPAAAPLRVAILPFQINAPSELSYLKDGIADMLASRLTWEDKVTVLRAEYPGKSGQPRTFDEKSAREAGALLQADMVFSGSLTAVGKTISIDVKLMDLSEEKPVRTFFIKSPTLDEVIPKIDLLAAEINETCFGRAPAEKTAPPPPKEVSKPVDASRMHPEKLVQGGFQDTGAAGQTDLFAPAPGAALTGATFWKSPNFNFLINGICLGDVNGDGKAETVVATPTEIRIYSMDKGRFSEIAKMDMGRFTHIVGVDAADINGNGYAEIFISALNPQKNAAQSVILEFNENRYVPLLENSAWFYRIVGSHTKNPVLLGQKIPFSDPFSGPIHEMIWNGGRYEEARKVTDAPRANLMGFAFGDIQNNGNPVYLNYDPYDHIQLLGNSGKTLWKGSEKLGGSTLYFTLPKEERGTENLTYLPMRLNIYDMDRNGKLEVVAVKNHEMVGGLLERFRVYSKSQFQFFSWDGLGLSLIRETRTLSGFIRDYFIGDFDNDGKEELVAAVISKEGSVAFTEPKSAVISYKLTALRKNADNP